LQNNNEFNITLNNGRVEIFIKIGNYNNLKILKQYKNSKKTIYNGKIIDKFSESLSNFGEYQYSIELTDLNNNIYVYTLPKINFTKMSLNIFDNDWWTD
jgi:hypothetical protein